MRATRAIAVLAVVAVTFLVAGFVVGRAVVAPEVVTIAEQRPADGSAAPGDGGTTTTTSDAAEPLRVMLAGDSVMAGLAPPLEAAIESSGPADVRFVLTPSILRDPTIRFTWQRELQRFDPEVIVLLVGTWELSEIALERGEPIAPGDDSWRSDYEGEILDPWIEFITQAGASVVWVGMPGVDNAEANPAFAALDDVFRDAGDRFDTVTYVAGGDTLGSPDDGFVETIALPTGEELRLRQTDGLHLCPGGALLLAEDVLDAVEAQTGRVPVDGWQEGGWRSDPAFPPDGCPD